MNKIPIEDLFRKHPTFDWEEGPSSYEELVESLGVEIILEEEDGAYQGDSYLVVKDGDRYGELTFGWGSCSGCDWFQSCITQAEFSELRDSLESRIQWFDDLSSLQKYVAGEEFMSWRTDGVDRFKASVAALSDQGELIAA